MQHTTAAVRQLRGDPPEQQRIMQLVEKTVAHNKICLQPFDLPQIPMQELDGQVLISGTLTRQLQHPLGTVDADHPGLWQ